MPAQAGAAPRAASGRLAAETTLTWSGAAAIRLRVAAPTQFRDSDVDLTTVGATYAFVRFLDPADASCPKRYGPHCLQSRASWVHGIDDTGAFDFKPASRRHLATFAVPPIIGGPSLDVYLFTDGRASVTIRTTSLRGKTAYTPAAGFRSHVALLNPTCVPLGCAAETGRTNGFTYGGEAFDLRGPGWVESFALNRDDADPNAGNQLHSIASCMFPNYAHPSESADPAAHPYGCVATEDAPTAVDETTMTAELHAISLSPGTMHGYDNFWTGARGPQYIGFQALGAGPSPGRAMTYGIWFSFL